MTRIERLRQRLRAGIDRLSASGLLWRLLIESVPGQKAKYLSAVAAMVVVAASASGAAWIMGEIVNAMTDAEARARVLYVAAGVAMLFFVRGIASFVQVVQMTRAGNRIVAEKQNQMYGRLLGQGVSFFNATESSDLLMRISHSAQMARGVIDTIVTGAVRDTLTLVGLVAVMVYQQPLLSAVCLILGPLVMWGLRKLLSRVREIMQQEMAGIAEIMRVVQETSAGVRVVKAFGLEDRMARRMDEAVRGVEKRANKIARLEAATAPLLDTLTGLAIAMIVALSAVKVFGIEAGSPGQLMSFVTALLMAYEPAKRLSKMRVSIEAGMVGVRMMYDMLDRPQSMTEHPQARALPPGPGAVRLAGLSFGYAPGQPVLRGIDLQIEPGTTVALVGPSGSGKSTILNLIMRLYDPDEGQVLIDGHDVREVSFASLRRAMAFVGQETFLFATTIRENLRVGRPEATDDEVVAAARLAHADDFIRDLPQGYDTQVGEYGGRLSGGQRQRIAIARAILRRAPILLLDEATSALDSHSETLVRDALEVATQGVTTIVIAHRLSTVLTADRICYLEGGRIVEDGTLSELLSRSGQFRALFDAQFSEAGRLGGG